jgi:transposase-like protein
LVAENERAGERSIQNILIAVVGGLKGFSEAINAVFPQTVVPTCFVHLVRKSMDLLIRFTTQPWNDRTSVARWLKAIYRAADAGARDGLETLAQGPWGQKYPTIEARAGANIGTWSSRSMISRKCAPDSLHLERDRSLELEAAPSGENQRPLAV